MDMIARSGGANFETMRKGWLPTAQETNALKVSELGIQQKQQQVDYEPERQAYLKQKRKADLTTQEQTTKLFEKEMKKYKTDEEFETKNRRLSVLSNYTRGAYARFKETEKISVAQDIFRENYAALKEAGNETQDSQLDRFLDPNTSVEDAENLLSGLNAVLPLAQEALDKQAVKKGGSLFERMLLARNSANPDISDPAKKYIDKTSGKTGSEQYNKTLSFKQKKERKAGTDKLGTQYRKEYDLFIKTDKNITEIKNALKSGDNAAMDRQVTGMLSNLKGGGIKAVSMYKIHDAPLGNIMERLKDTVSGFIGGVKTDFQKQEILDAVSDLQKYNNMVLNEGKGKFRGLARKQNYDATIVAPFDTFDEVKNYVNQGFWDNKQATEYLLQNPRLLKGLKK